MEIVIEKTIFILEKRFFVKKKTIISGIDALLLLIKLFFLHRKPNKHSIFHFVSLNNK